MWFPDFLIILCYVLFVQQFVIPVFLENERMLRCNIVRVF